jgi:hypothetical protein
VVERLTLLLREVSGSHDEEYEDDIFLDVGRRFIVLMTEALRTFETSIFLHEAKRRYIFGFNDGFPVVT